MAYSTRGPAEALIALLSGLAGLGAVKTGVPESVGKRLEAFVTMGGQTIGAKATGTTYRDARYYVSFVYRLDGDEAAAELALMDLVDAFIMAVDADRTLGGSCQGTAIDPSPADDPEYRNYSGQECRQYPILVTARQCGGYNTNP